MQKNILKLIIAFLLIQTFLSADKIEVINEMPDTTIYACMYYVKMGLMGKSIGPADRYSPVVEIRSKEKQTLDRSKRKPNKNRELIFSEKKDELKDKLNINEYKNSMKQATGWFQGAVFHISKKEGLLRGYGDVEWKVVKPTIEFLEKKVVDPIIKELQKKHSKHPYANKVARVRFGTKLGAGEKAFLAKRLPKVKTKLEEILGMKLKNNEVPRIAICLSGGGTRAALTSYGLCNGLDELGLLDSTVYIVSLSGSTWFLSHFTELGLPIKQYGNHLIEALSKERAFSIGTLSRVLWEKYAFQQPTSIVDLYGVYLANRFFRHINNEMGRQKIRLTNLQRHLKNADKPFSIFTVVESEPAGPPITWFECNPYEVGSYDKVGNYAFHAHIPTWAFGRKFVEGKSTDNAPEQTLGFFMGMWGSALSGSIEEILATKGKELDPKLSAFLGEIRIAPVKAFNPLYGVADAQVRTKPLLSFADAGYAYNLPLPPLIHPERKVDIIIAIDVSETVHVAPGAGSLRQAEEDFKKRELPFPKINYDGILQRTLTVFNDKNNPKAPTIIYVPPIKNIKYDTKFDPATNIPSTYPSKKFVYSKKEEITKFADLIRFNIVDNKEAIINAIKDRVKMKQRLAIMAKLNKKKGHWFSRLFNWKSKA